MSADIIYIFIIFVIGFICVLTTSNMIRMVIGLEIMARAATYAFIYFGHLTGNMAVAQALVVTVIVVEVVVSATALALIVNVYRHTKSLDVRKLIKLKG